MTDEELTEARSLLQPLAELLDGVREGTLKGATLLQAIEDAREGLRRIEDCQKPDATCVTNTRTK